MEDIGYHLDISQNDGSESAIKYPLHAAARQGHADTLLSLVQAGPQQAVNQANFDSITPLHEACGAGSPQCVSLLLDAGARVDARNIDGATPLCDASCSGNVECVNLLLQHGAKVNPSLNLLTSPLHEAVLRDRQEVMKVLLEVGADVEISDLHFGNALHVAAFKDHCQAAVMLLKAGAAVNAAKTHMTALHLAAINNSVSMATVVLEFGANVYAENLWGKRPCEIVEKEYGMEAPLFTLLSQWEGQPRSLMASCRLAIRKSLGKGRLKKMDSLGLPRMMKEFLKYSDF